MAKLAILGGKPIRTKPWHAWPVFGPEEERNVLEVMRSGKWWYGERVREFEQAYAKFQDAAHGISCSNGTVAIEVALLAAGVGAGHEVITTPYTFMATTSSILKANAIPVFADVSEATGNLDPDEAEKLITPRTKAILPVHVGGMPADIDRFEEIGRKHKIAIIYDAAHGWGSQWRGKGVGAYGAFNTYSFQQSKNITAGEGGMTLTCDENLAEAARSYTNCGRSAKGAWYEHFLLGANLRLTEFQAAILLAQLGRLEEQTLRRQKNAAKLKTLIAHIDGITPAADDPRVTRRAYHFYVFRYDKDAFGGAPREKFIKAMAAEGTPVMPGWPLLYKMPLFASYKNRKGAGACPVSCPYYKGHVPDYSSLHLPVAERLSTEADVWLCHTCLLGEESDDKDTADAIAKLRENTGELLAIC